VALVVLLRGVNVGGHRVFRPAALARELKDLDVVNIGAAGTLVVRAPVTRARLRAELAKRLPFETAIIVCQGRDIVRLVRGDTPARRPTEPGIVRFVSVMSGPTRASARLPIRIPPTGEWLLQILERDGRFVVGQYRRHMKTIGHLGALDRLLGVPVTTRNWNTMASIARVLAGEAR
jgi:uncharacterized protein (DUF1697 family)